MNETKLKNCPVCGWEFLPILYGYPTKEALESKDVFLGGCIIEPDSPDIGCSNCQWTGDEWQVSAPLMSTVWIIQDRAGLVPPIGLVSLRFDEIEEQFIFGFWQEIKMTAEYENWLAAAVDPVVFTALFGDLSPGLIAQFRIGSKMLTEEEFIDANFEEISKPPKFDFNQVMRRMEH